MVYLLWLSHGVICYFFSRSQEPLILKKWLVCKNCANQNFYDCKKREVYLPNLVNDKFSKNIDLNI